MKKKSNLIWATLLAVVAIVLTGCGEKDYTLFVSSQDMRFGLEPETQTIILRSNCKWTIDKKNDADWFTVSPMSGGPNDSIITVTVSDYSGGQYRGTSFVINSPNYHVRRTVFVAQTYVDFYNIINKVFGVTFVEHWNTDYFGQIVEDSYKKFELNPYDTTAGYLMYFLEDGVGVQRDHHEDTAVYYMFTYEYDPIEEILHIEFETVVDAPESYAPQVLTATDSLYRFMHEYKPKYWERADMRKVGAVLPGEKSLLMRSAKKRENVGGIFRME